MSKETLIVKNFGPIKDVELELGKVNVFIGEQAGGKSTLAKLIAICRDWEILDRGIGYMHLFKWLNIENYFAEKTQIIYENMDYKIKINNDELSLDLNTEFKNKVRRRKEIRTEVRNQMAHLVDEVIPNNAINEYALISQQIKPSQYFPRVLTKRCLY